MKEIILQNDYIENVAHDQLVVKCAVGTAERGGAVKILCQTAEVKITAVEALEKSASVSGKVTYKLLYLDRENTPQGLDYFCEFSERIQDERIAADMHIIAEASVVDLSASLSGEEFHLSAVVDVKLASYAKQDIKTQEAEGEGYICKYETQAISRMEALPETTFELTQEVESGGKVDRVLWFGADAVVSEVVCGENTSVVNGQAVAEVVYVREGEIRTERFSLPFSEEISPCAAADVTVSVKNSRLVLEGNDENVVFDIGVFLSLKGFAVQEEGVRLLTDAYSLQKELRCEKQCAAVRVFAGENYLEKVVSTSAEEEGLPEGSVLLGACSTQVRLANLIAGEGGITVEGLVVTDLLYRLDELLRTVRVEIPFSSFFQTTAAKEDILTAETLVKSVTAGLAAGVPKISVELLFHVKRYALKRLCWVSSCVEGEEVALSPYGISICYVPSGKDAWEIAKELRIDPDSLAETEGEGVKKIAVFRQRKE